MTTDNPMNKEVLKLNLRIRALKRQVKALRRQAMVADGEIAYNRIKALTDRNTELEQDLEEKVEEVDHLHAKIESFNDDLSLLLKDLTE